MNHKNSNAQLIAKKTMTDIFNYIEVGMSEYEILEFATNRMLHYGSNSWWYHGFPGMVLIGERSILSISGKDYTPSKNTRLKSKDIISIDLAPTLDGEWGDYARTFILEDNQVKKDHKEILDEELRLGIEIEIELHRIFLEELNPLMTFSEIFRLMNKHISDLGFENLDFKKNLGHSVEIDQKDRVYFEEGNDLIVLEYGKPVTFEPHIRKAESLYGFKKENIYSFNKKIFKEI